MQNKKLIAALVAVAIIAWIAGQACAADVVRHNYVTYWAPEVDGADADNQARWQGTMPVDLPDVLGEFIDLKGAYTLTGTGFMDIESSPVTMDHAPEVYFEYDAGPGVSFNVGMIHGSNGEDGTLSRSWNRAFGRMNLHKAQGDWTIDATAMVFNVFDTENAELYDLRAIGNEGKWGVEFQAFAEHIGYGSLNIDLRDNFALVTVSPNGLSLTDSIQPSVFLFSGKGAQLEALASPERALGVGGTVTF